MLCNGKREARAASRRRQLELGTAKDELFELLRRILAVKMRIHGFLTIIDPFKTV